MSTGAAIQQTLIRDRGEGVACQFVYRENVALNMRYTKLFESTSVENEIMWIKLGYYSGFDVGARQ